MKLAKRIFVCAVGMTLMATGAIANEGKRLGEELAGKDFTFKQTRTQTAPESCYDFSGYWVGKCTNFTGGGNDGHELTRTIVQKGCETIRDVQVDYAIGGITTVGTPTWLMKTANWNSKFNGIIFLNAQSQPAGQISYVGESQDVWSINKQGQLVMQLDGHLRSLRPGSDKIDFQETSATCVLDKQ